MTMANNHPPRNIDLDKIPLQPQRWKYVLSLILARFNWRHAVKDKGVSFDTMEDRRQFLFRVFDTLLHNPIKTFKLDPRSLSGRHVDVLMTIWRQRAEAGELSASSLQKYHSILRTFTAWIGNPNLVKPLSAYFDDAALYKRCYVAKVSKAPRARGVDTDKLFAEIEARDVRAAAATRLIDAFGLRFKEGVMCRPHADVVTAAQAGKPATDTDMYLHVHRGTKGGRRRYVPIDTPERQRAVDIARLIAKGENESVSDPQLTLTQAIRHLRYVLECCGMTKADLKVTPHGFRHQYAADEYERVTSMRPPVEGGAAPDKAIDAAARQDVSMKLGHGRPDISNAYLGCREDAAPDGSAAVGCPPGG
jgi:integrase